MIIGLRLDLAGVELTRHRRGRCAACERRRVRFSLRALGPGGAELAESDRLCAECAGIVLGDRPTSLDEEVVRFDLTHSESQQPDNAGNADGAATG